MEDEENGITNCGNCRKVMTKEMIDILVSMLEDNDSPKKIAKTLKISVKTVYKWQIKYEECNKNVENLKNDIKKRGRKQSESNTLLKDQICEIIQADCRLTQKGIGVKLKEMGSNVVQGTISKQLKKAEITRKRLRKKSVKITSPEVISQRKCYAREMRGIRSSRILFLDETGFNLHSKNNYGYSPKNTQAFSIVPSNRGRNISVISLLSSTKLVHTKIIDGPYNGQLLMEFLEECVGHFRSIDFPFLVMDNVKFHHVRDVSIFAERNNIQLRYLPPYSPDLNPIENVFGTLKARYYNVRPTPGTKEEVKQTIFDVITEMNEDENLHFYTFYEHMQKFLDRAFNGELF